MASKKTIAAALVTLVVCSVALEGAIAAGECGKTPIPRAAMSLSPCLGAASNGRAKVSPSCCGRVSAMMRASPRCLCAVLLSPMAKKAGINAAVAITIPKRCNIRNRPVGKKCGRKTMLNAYKLP